MIFAKDLPNWFSEPGAYVLVDGQYGSTGKGVMAAILAEVGRGRITHVTTNAGPNSGHTAYWPLGPDDGTNWEKIVTQQIPVASVFLEKMGEKVTTYINAGAIIDQEILAREVKAWFNNHAAHKRIVINPCAAVINDADRILDAVVVNSVAGTGKGVGPAIQRKIGREGVQNGRVLYWPMLPTDRSEDHSFDRFWDWNKDVVLVETAQGFSLGLNTARFAPYTTSRECTVAQAISDARIPPQKVRKVVACFRTFPIRVGFAPNGASSGDCYEDQVETSWEAIGVEPEITTVTKRVRRVFTWSRRQFMDCVAANEPDVLFINMANYMKKSEYMALVDQCVEDYVSVLGHGPDAIIAGHSAHHEDAELVY